MGILKRNKRKSVQTSRKESVRTLSFLILFVLFVVALFPCPASGFELYARTSRVVAPGFSVQPLYIPESGGDKRSLKEKSKVTLKSIPEKVVLLHFWATWCTACAEELPALDVMNRRYAKSGVRLLAVALDSKRNVRAYLKEHDIDVPIYFDRFGAVMRAYGVSLLPVTVVILKKGGEARVAGRLLGAKEWGSAEGTAFIDKLLAAE